MSPNNEVLTLSGVILGIGVFLIVAIGMVFLGNSAYQTHGNDTSTLTDAVLVEDINTKVASLAEPQKEVVLQGHKLFQANCVQCHAINRKVVGPALKDVGSRWSSQAEIINFIKYPEKVIMGGKNDYAKQLYNEYGQMMPNHDFFKDEQIQSILTYIKFESGEEIAMK